MAYCGRCGNPVAEGTLCPTCGTPSSGGVTARGSVGSVPSEVTPSGGRPLSPGTPSQLLTYVAIGIACIALVVSLFAIISPSNNSGDDDFGPPATSKFSSVGSVTDGA